MIRVAQILLPDAPQREKRLLELDRASLAGRAEIETIAPRPGGLAAAIRFALASAPYDLAHLYGPHPVTPEIAGVIALPFVASCPTRRSRLPWRTARQPDAVLDTATVPPAVDPGYFEIASRAMPSSFRIGCAPGSRVARAVAEGTRHRIERFRDDIRWMFFDDVPAPAEMSLLNAWVDAEIAGNGDETGVAEALAAGRAVIAAATAANRDRLDEGAAGFLVPPEDPNETAHAVLAALFKPELRDPRIARGRQKAESWRPERRAERLLEIYARLRRQP